MQPDPQSKLGSASQLRLLRCILTSISILFILFFCYAAWHRLHFPFELDRMESGVLTSVWRIVHGRPLYTAPSLEFVPFLYTPIYFYLSAFVAKFTGVGYIALRLVSTLATLGNFGLIYVFVWLETRRHLPAIAAAGLFASIYSLLFAWYDIGRVDSLSVFFFLFGLLATRFFHPAVAAVLWVVAFQTKQEFLPLPPLLFLYEWRRPVRVVTGIVSYIAFAGASILWLNHATNGWYSFYVFGTSSQLKWLWRGAVLYIPVDLFGVLGICFLLIAIAIALGLFNLSGRRGNFYLFASTLVFALIGFVRSHDGANINAIIPAYALTTVLFGLALERLLRWAEALPDAWRTRTASLLLVAAIVQLSVNLYNPHRWKPTDTVRGYREVFLKQLREAPGDVWVVNHSWDSIVAGKPEHAELDALDAILSRPVSEKTRSTVQELQNAYSTGRFSAIILDRPAESYEPRAGFTSPLFTVHYGLRIEAAGGEQTDVDQPHVIYAPCNADQLPGDPWKTGSSFVSRAECH